VSEAPLAAVPLAVLVGALTCGLLFVPAAWSAPPKARAADAGPSDFGAAADAGAHHAPKDAGTDAFHLDRTPPDPPPLVTAERWLFDLRWQNGEPRLVGVTRADLIKPEPSARVFGRFAIELFEGKTLIERVRFDFPMLNEPSAPKSIDLQKKLSTRIGVFFPRTARGNRLELLDRATDRRWSLPWPPEPGPQGSR